ncbi:MAG: Bug family tripartite tricarboxylate transporter substrate binding protein [Noviherbaspirillum sp.]
MNRIRIGMAALGLFAAQFAMADAYPTKPITLVVPFSAGGGTDAVARLLAEKMKDGLKTSVIVENRPGASAQIGTRHVIDSAADGYTVLVATTSLINSPYLFAKMPYDAMKQLRPVVSVADMPIFLAVRQDLPAKNVAEFVELAKKSDGKMNYGSAGPGTTLHLSAEWLKANAGFKATHVPFKGSGQAVTALSGGHVDWNMENLSAVQAMTQANKVRLLAVAAPKRHPLTPDVPTLGESGLPNVNLATWSFLMVPSGTPDAVVARLNKEVNHVLAMPEVQDKLFKQGFVPTGGTPEETLQRMKDEAVQWSTVIKSANISVQ